MNRANIELERTSDSGLERVIEPLASYICATERPRAALMSALVVLVSEVCHTNRTAHLHISTFLENHLS
jgi:hypothetical protein